MATASLAGCAGDGSTVAVPVRFSLDEPTCGTSDMTQMPLHTDCGGAVEFTLFERTCFSLPWGTPLHMADLPELVAPAFGQSLTENSIITVSVDVYSNLSVRNCDDLDEARGSAQAIVSGSSDTITIGEASQIDVPLTCQTPFPTCQPGRIVGGGGYHLAAGVKDFITNEPMNNDLSLHVLFGYARPAIPATWERVADLAYDGEVTWSTQHNFELENPIPGDCYATRVNWIDEVESVSRSFLSCEGTVIGRNVLSQGYYLDDETVDDILQALDVMRIPGTGVLIGQVVDEMDQPVSNVAVRSPDGIPGIAIEYLTDTEPMALQSGATSRNGLFVVRQYPVGYATCCGHFTAVTDTHEGRTTAKVGLVKGMATLTRLRLLPK